MGNKMRNKMKTELREAGVEKQRLKKKKITCPEHMGINLLLGLKSRRWR